MRNLDAVPAQIDLSLYTGEEYFAELQKNIAETKPGDRVAVMTMSIDPTEPLVRDTLREMNSAADRDVDTLLLVDSYAMFLDTDHKAIGPHWSPITRKGHVFEQRQQAVNALNEKVTGRASFINQPTRPFTNPYAGRSHIKGAVVNNMVYLGGPNLHHTTRLDAVAGFEDKNTADWVYGLAVNIAKAGSTNAVLRGTDQKIPLASNAHILLDAGRPGQSAILEESLRLVDSAEEWISFSSQFVPNGRVVNRIVSAAQDRGVGVQVVYNDPSYWGSIGGVLQRHILSKQKRRAAELFDNGKLPAEAPAMHAKVLATEKGAMVGTHNLSEAGVKFGTPEIALFSSSPGFALTARRLLMQQVEIALSNQET